MTPETENALLRQSVENLELQVKRLIAHIESEQRVSQNHERRIEATEKRSDRIEKQGEKHETLLFNTGKGLAFRVQGIEHKLETHQQEKEETRWTWDRFLSLAGVAVVVIIEVIKIFIK